MTYVILHYISNTMTDTHHPYYLLTFSQIIIYLTPGYSCLLSEE